MQKLLELEVDAASFLMPDDDMSRANNAQIAHDDLMGQLAKLPAEIHDKIFPKRRPLPEIAHLPVTPVTATEEDDDDGGMGSGMGMGMSPGRTRQRPRQDDGPGMSM